MNNEVLNSYDLDIIRAEVERLLPKIESKSNDDLLEDIENSRVFISFTEKVTSIESYSPEENESTTGTMKLGNLVRGVVCDPENKELIEGVIDIASDTVDTTGIVTLLVSLFGIPVAAFGTVPSVLVKLAVLLSRFGINKFCGDYSVKT